VVPPMRRAARRRSVAGMSILSESPVETLRERLRGPLLAAGDAGFEEATRLWNGVIDKAPALVVQPTGTADVAEAVRFAREHEVPLSVRGGGHNIAGTALVDGGLTIDMSRLRGIVVDPEERTVTVQPGCLLGDVDRETQLHGLATPLGFISEVGMAGLTLGGGLGYLTRRFGWTVDNLIEVEIVTADGQVRRASRDEHDDLFWAVRGAGANLGVVTSFVLQLHGVGPNVYGERICGMAVCYSGDLDRADEALAPIRALGEPIFDLLEELPYTQVQSYLDDTEPKGNHYYWRTGFAAELSDELLATTRELFAECPIPGAELGFLHLGGALNDHPGDDGAVGNRDARYAIGANAMWEPGESGSESYAEWIRGAWARIAPFSTGGNYINFQTADEGDLRIRDTYGANFDRLVAIKRKYDPDNLFRSNRNVRP
jgi:FAD/FMN-containing dehydrogenase